MKKHVTRSHPEGTIDGLSLMDYVAQMREEQAVQMESFKAELQASLLSALQSQLAEVSLASAAAPSTRSSSKSSSSRKRRPARRKRRAVKPVAALQRAPPLSDREKVKGVVRLLGDTDVPPPSAYDDYESEESSEEEETGSDASLSDEEGAEEQDFEEGAIATAAATAKAEAADERKAAALAATAAATVELLTVEDPEGGATIVLEKSNPAAQVLLASRRLVDTDPMLVKAREALAQRDAERAAAAAGRSPSKARKKNRKKTTKRRKKKGKTMSRKAAALAATRADAAALADADASPSDLLVASSDLLVAPPGMGPDDLDASVKSGNATTLFDRTLQENEWENEIARSILTLFRSQQLRGGGEGPKGGKKKKTKKSGSGKKKKKTATPPPKPLVSKRGGGSAVPKRYLSRQIWFGGGGTLVAEWSAAASEEACARLDMLEKDGRPLEYIALAEQVLVERHRRLVLPQIYAETGGLTRSAQHAASLSRSSPWRSSPRQNRSSPHRGRSGGAMSAQRTQSPQLDEWGEEEEEEVVVPPPPEREETGRALRREQLLWRQLCSACCIFAWRLTRAGRFADALGLLKKAEEVTEDERSPFEDRRELRAFYLDGYAHYYYRRNKGNAALDYAQKALRLHMQLGQWVHAAQCTLHVASILYKLQKYDGCLHKLGKVLVMVERGQLEDGGVSSQKIALVAVCYHNVAVTQLNIGQFQEACIASQNGRRLARLSLAYCNRWVEHMEHTHRQSLAALCREQEFADVLRAQQAQGGAKSAATAPATQHLSAELTQSMYT